MGHAVDGVCILPHSNRSVPSAFPVSWRVVHQCIIRRIFRSLLNGIDEQRSRGVSLCSVCGHDSFICSEMLCRYLCWLYWLHRYKRVVQLEELSPVGKVLALSERRVCEASYFSIHDISLRRYPNLWHKCGNLFGLISFGFGLAYMVLVLNSSSYSAYGRTSESRTPRTTIVEVLDTWPAAAQIISRLPSRSRGRELYDIRLLVELSQHSSLICLAIKSSLMLKAL